MDEEFIDALRPAFRPDHLDPPPESVTALARVVALRFPTGPRPFRWKARYRVAGAALAIGLSGAVAAIVSGTALPTPLRTLARSAGLPIDSAALAATKSDAAKLRDDLHDRDTIRIPADASALHSRFVHLDPGDKSQVDAQVSTLLQQAAAYARTGGPNPQVPLPEGRGRGPAPTSQIGEPTTVAGTVQPTEGDHGGGGDGGPGPSTTSTTVSVDDGGRDNSTTTTTTTPPPSTTTSTTVPTGSDGGPGPSGSDGGSEPGH